jgi:hypothetical protein
MKIRHVEKVLMAGTASLAKNQTLTLSLCLERG